MKRAPAQNPVKPIPNGGRNALAGFLFQILRSLRLGLTTSIAFVGKGSGLQMQLVLEPDDGGDHHLFAGSEQLIEQVKFRSLAYRWSISEVARDVLPNLLAASKPGARQTFKFVTNNPAGLAQLEQYLAIRRRSCPAETVALKWRGKRVSLTAFEQSLAAEAGVAADDPGLQHLLDNLGLVIVDTTKANQDTLKCLQPLLGPGERARTKTHELVGLLFEAASKGQTLEARDLLLAVSEYAFERLALVNTLPPTLLSQVESCCTYLKYNEAQQAREGSLEFSAGFNVLTGESGQGKTWSLCQAALMQAKRNQLALLTPAPESVPDLVALINEQLWQGAYGQPTSLSNIARRLGPHFTDSQGYWLTVYVDDIQDRKFARQLKQRNWLADGIRIVVSCQPRITEVLADRAEAKVLQIGDFTSTELRRFLAYHNRDDPLETMPDDVFELLLKPIHARVFAQLPVGQYWHGATEYELFQEYWHEACLVARDQRDHPSDEQSLVNLAALLLVPGVSYPWTARQVHSTGLSDDALIRLEQVGLLRMDGGNAVSFSTDRMLNWAVAEAIVERIVRRGISAKEADAELAALDELQSKDGTPLGRRLGYVFMDALWLLCHSTEPEFVAELLLARMARRPPGWRDRSVWDDQLATLGTALLPVLEVLAARSYKRDDWEILPGIISAAVAISDAASADIAAFVGRLLQSGSGEAADIAIGIATQVACPSSIDALWRILLARDEAFRRQKEQGEDDRRNIDHWRARNEAARALHLAIEQDLEWLELELASNTDRHQQELLLTALVSRGVVPFGRALACWDRCKERLRSVMPDDSYALASAIGYFRDPSMMDWLDGVPYDPKKFTSARVMQSKALIDPDRALQDVATGRDRHDWALADWWLDELAEYHADRLADALEARTRTSDNPLVETVMHYRNCPEALTPAKLNWILDEYAEALTKLNNELDDRQQNDTDMRLGRLGHVMRLLTKIIEPWQFEQLAARASTPLETELVRWASRRQGRTTRNVDHDGAEAERVLATIGGQGIDQLAIAELQRGNPYGREDGYRLALWTDGEAVGKALADANEEPGEDGYRRVVMMEAMAAHRCDGQLEAMVRNGAPIYVNAADMRAARGRAPDVLLSRVRQLARSKQPAERLLAARLAGFLPHGLAQDLLLPMFLASGTNTETRLAIVATFQAADTYHPSMLEPAAALLTGQPDQQVHFVALYLSRCGDAEARQAVTDWMADRDLGSGSVSDRSYLLALARHDDSRPAVVDLLRRSKANGHLLIQSWQLELLAEDGDEDALRQLSRASYRKSDFGEGLRVAAIRHVQCTDPEEAYFCARRMWAMTKSPAAISLLLEINSVRAVPLLLGTYSSESYSVRMEIARRLRTGASLPDLITRLAQLATSSAVRDRKMAAELAGWVPAELDIGWLRSLASDDEQLVAEAARTGQDRRSKEEAALRHLQLMAASNPAQRWARMQALFDLVDPYLLWRRDDPLSLECFFEEQPPEFFVEAERLKKQRERKLDQDAKRAEQDVR